ncbi:DNA alkylation repair protein [Kocuria atrinae]|uniref:DNA alkylation repair protein n=1 Tax=Kocuria atrinae TaxID=592377 RepID=A0ABP5J3E5_9MICC
MNTPSVDLPAKLIETLISMGNERDAQAKAKYLQAVPGGYGEGDQFVGVRVPAIRSLAREAMKQTTLDDAAVLLDHEIHEVRLLGTILLVELFKPARADKDAVIQLLLAKADRLNNWDLVDTVVPYTLGPWLLVQPTDKATAILNDLADSPVLWRRRMAMVSTLGQIRLGHHDQAPRLAAKLQTDPHHLMHKAVGWMLRGVGNKNRVLLDAFLNEHAATLPRTALRYALEKHDTEARARYLAMAQER